MTGLKMKKKSGQLVTYERNRNLITLIMMEKVRLTGF